MPDHIHLVLRIPPKFSVALVVGYLKGKSAIQLHREALGVKKGFTGKHFWSRGYCVSTVGLDEATVRAYVRNQEALDKCRVPLDYVDIRSRRLLESRRFLNDLIVALRRRP